MSTPREAVVLIPGLWLPAWSLWLQARRLRRCDYDVHVFSWRSVRRDFRENAAALQEYLAGIAAPTAHLVGYSLGGVLIRALHHYFPSQCVGRIVTWGSPHGGSRAAESFARLGWGRRILGRSVTQLLTGEPAGWLSPQGEVGVLAGSLPFGFGALIARLPRMHDGVVALDEARCPQATDTVVLRVSHAGMLCSRAVAEHTCRFLRTGRFAP